MTNLEKMIANLDPEEQEELLRTVEEYKDSKNRELSQLDFIRFVKSMWPGFIDGRHHKVMAKKFQEIADGKIKRLIINMPPRHAILTSMKIPTTHGWKTMADLAVGDYVFGPDGMPVEVIGKSEVFKGRELYRVTTDDGSYLDVDGEHLWNVRLDRKHDIYHDYTTEDLWRRQNGEILRTKRGGGVEFIGKTDKVMRKPRLPDVMPVKYPEKTFVVDPYVLGVWLGDGHSNQAIITAKDEDAVYIRHEIERRGYQTTDQNTPMTFGIFRLKEQLREIGVLGKKHIPQEYLQGSPQQRRDLLKGLMDTDGNISKAGQCFFSQSNLDFIKQVQELLFSLGIKNKYSVTEAKIGDKSYGDTWRISFYAKDVAHLPRKEERTANQKNTYGRYIEIENLNVTGDTQCIKVDREDGLFLAGDGYICTHNTKSEFASFMLPAWFLGRFPNKKIIQCSNTAELAVGFGRKVRNLVDSDAYAKIFPNVGLRQDSKAAGRWSTNHNGEYFAIGVGGTVTGKGADLLIIDDPHSEQEAALASNDPSVFDKVYEWYTSGPRQRLQPGGSIVVVMCMTGDTPVLMSNGTQKLLKDIRQGDEVATFDNGRLSSTKVNNWQSSGVDSIYKIQTQSGKILRANKRHPFLVMNEGVLEWTRLNQLRKGDLLVSLKDAKDHLDQKQNKENADLAKQKQATTEKTQMHHTNHSGIMENGKVCHVVLRVAVNLLRAVGYVLRITGKNTLPKSHQNTPANTESSTGMGLPLNSMKQWFRNVKTYVMFVASLQVQKILGRTGTESSALITATKLEKSEDCYATTAILLSDTERRQAYLNELHRISDFTVDQIISITPDGEEEVFDVEINKTENFIANGFVSHNTRWSKRDLTGRIVQSSIDRDGDEWEIIDFPAILPSNNPLWPEFWSYEELDALRTELPLSKWNAQYQQQPTSEQGAIVKREWWREWEPERPPPCEFLIQSWDTAFTKNERSDYSACTTWGVFYLNEDPDNANIILLDAFKYRMEFPELKQKALEHYREWEPDAFIVEAKAAGSPLIYELRQMGIPVSEFTPTRGNDKIARINSVSDLFASGKVWAPRTRWAEEVIEEMAAFPNSEHDDLVDSSTQALIRFRKGGFVRLESDEQDDLPTFKRKATYY